eukprot:31490-Pelagococcus_subviridis.AAC.12
MNSAALPAVAAATTSASTTRSICFSSSSSSSSSSFESPRPPLLRSSSSTSAYPRRLALRRLFSFSLFASCNVFHSPARLEYVMLSRTLPANNTGSCPTSATTLCNHPWFNVRTSTPSKPLQEVEDGGLPRAGSADERDARPRARDESKSVQDHLRRPRGVSERHGVEFHPPLEPRYRAGERRVLIAARVGRIVRRRRRVLPLVDDVEHRGGGAAALVHGRARVQQVPDVLLELPLVQHERDERVRAHLRSHHERAAVAQQRDRDAQLREERVHHAEIYPRRRRLRVAKLVPRAQSAVVSAGLERLARERPHGPHGRDRLERGGVRGRERVLRRRRVSRHPPAVELVRRRRRRDHRARDRAEPRVLYQEVRRDA